MATRASNGMHPNSLKNLKPFVKGKEPTGGRPKGALGYKERFNKYLQMERPLKLPDGTVKDKTILDGIIFAAMAKASQGDMKAAEFVFNRAFGKEPDKMELTGRDGQPLEIEHTERLRTAWQDITEAFTIEHNGTDERPSEK